jgi:hypothetical protein
MNIIWSNVYIKTIVLPESLVSIGDYSFDGCSHLTSVTIGNNVTSIGMDAFNTSGLTGITIPAGVTSISPLYVFTLSRDLTAISVDPANTSYKSVGGVLYNKAGTTLIQYPNAKATSFSIPSGVTTIERSAFQATDLASVTIPNTVTTIKSQSFLGSKLNTVNIPASVTDIASIAFEISTLVSFTVDPSNPNYSADDGVLYNKDKTTLVQYPHGKSDTSFNIPPGVTTIGSCALRSWKITSITIPASVTVIDTEAFEGSGITSITIPAGVTSIGWYAFGMCHITSVTFDGSIAVFGGQNAFPDNDSSWSGSNKLWDKYQIGGAGTYTLSGDTWTK